MSPSVGRLVGRWEVVDPLVVVKTLNLVVVGRRVVVEYRGVSVVSIVFSQILSFDCWETTETRKRKLILSGNCQE